MDTDSVPEHVITSILVSQQSVHTLTSTCAMLATFLFLLKRPRIGCRGNVCRPHARRTFAEITGNYSERKFKLHFGMSRSAFTLLLHMLWPDISDYENNVDGYEKEMDRHRTGKCTQASIKLAILLRIMQGGSIKDVATSFDVGVTLVYNMVYYGTALVMKKLEFEKFPTTHKELRRAAQSFATSRNEVNPLPGCIAAVDGLSVALNKPERLYNPASFWCRKGYYAIPVQAVVSSEYKFMAVSVACTGSTHDSMALKMSHIGRYIDAQSIPFGYWIAADDAYMVCDNLVTPFRKSMLNKYTESFNFFQSSHRMHVEQAFGQLVSRWRILKRPLAFRMETCTQVIMAAVLLHNFCKEYDEMPYKSDRTECITEATARLNVWLKWCHDNVDLHATLGCRITGDSRGGFIRALQRSECRRRLLLTIHRQGILKPPWASITDYIRDEDEDDDLEAGDKE